MNRVEDDPPVYRGVVKGGFVVLPEGVDLAEGSEVLVVPPRRADGPSGGRGTPPIWDALSRLGRSVESEPTDLPPDLARDHDHYVHGAPRRS